MIYDIEGYSTIYKIALLSEVHFDGKILVPQGTVAACAMNCHAQPSKRRQGGERKLEIVPRTWDHIHDIYVCVCVFVVTTCPNVIE